ncbi:MAG: PAS domain S-box protein, partial [Gaiellaceae bacterium]
QNAELEALQETAFDLLNRHDAASMLEGIVARAGDLLGTPNGYLYLVDQDRDQLHLEVGLGVFAGHEGVRLARGSGLSGKVWKEERAIAVGDYAEWSDQVTRYSDLGVHATAGVPLRSAGAVIGVLGIAYQDPARACGEPELALLSRFGQLASLALENMRLYADAQRELEERREAEEALRKSQELYRAIVESSADVIALLDLDGTALYVSPAHERVLGYRQDELIGRAVLEHVHPDDVERAAVTIAASVGGEAQRSETVTRFRHKDGHWIDMEGVTSVVRNEAGEPEMILTIARDVTERNRAAEDKAKLEEELRQAQKMEAVGRLAGGVAHDFNNLLTAITGYGDLALARLDEDSPARRNVEEMKRAGERAAALTRQLLAFSRKQVLQPKVLDLNDVVGGLEGMLARVLGEDVELATGLEPELGRTRADPGQIEQVVLNLAINARDAMPRGGRLTITTSNVELDDFFVAVHPGATPGQFVQLAVSDTGEGMDRETLGRVFEPFFTTKPPGQGTGLGLSTVYGIVSQTGGQIWAYSEPGRGTAFKVYLPRVWDVAADREEQRAQPGLGGTETVLLVEDEAIVRSLVREMLERAGYTVLEAADGDEAAALADEHAGAIDLLMTDVVMPGVGGQQLAARMLQERPGLRVLFTSGYTEAAIMHHGVLAPDTAFLEKPFTAVDLGRKVRELLDGHEDAGDSSVRRLSPARAAGDF